MGYFAMKFCIHLHFTHVCTRKSIFSAKKHFGRLPRHLYRIWFWRLCIDSFATRFFASLSAHICVINEECIRAIDAGYFGNIFWVQNGAVLVHGRSMAEIHYARVAVRDIDDCPRQRQCVQNVRCILNGAQRNRRDARQHLTRHIRLHRQRNIAQIEMAAIRFCIEEC